MKTMLIFSIFGAVILSLFLDFHCMNTIPDGFRLEVNSGGYYRVVEESSGWTSMPYERPFDAIRAFRAEIRRRNMEKQDWKPVK